MADKKSTVYADGIPLPMCVIDEKGKVVLSSGRMDEVFAYAQIEGADIFTLTGVKGQQFREAEKEQTDIIISRSDKDFKVVTRNVPYGAGNLALYFLDVTEGEELKKKYENEAPCFMVVDIDNYDELSSNTPEENLVALQSEIDKVIRAWAAETDSSVTRFKERSYFMVMQRAQLEKQRSAKFDVLDRIREIETETDFPVTLSIGIGIGGANFDDNDRFANEATDIAKGRGGDQAVIKDKDTLYYYGGKTQAVEKNNKGKSRVIGYALDGLMKTSEKVMIMGHKNPDMDAFGAALGMYRMAKTRGIDAYIVIDSYNEALEIMYREAVDSDEYKIIGCERALELTNDKTLVIVVDTHRPSLTECPELLVKAPRVVVIDHHRKSEESVEAPTLAYTEPYASSASELVTEILQYTTERRDLTHFEAEALMAGILLDTNRFSVKTGVRTFEAAAWLKRAGADMAAVKKYFQVAKETFQMRYEGIEAAEYDEYGMAFSVCRGQNMNAQIINSQVADELLTVDGIRGSFVASRDDKGRTVISARSIGSLNVQVVMEHFGGGGHMNTAGAQIEGTPEEAIEKVKKILEKMRDESNTAERR